MARSLKGNLVGRAAATQRHEEWNKRIEDDLKEAQRAQNWEEDGYVNGAPSLDAAAIDSAVCHEAKCPECGHEGMHYDAWHKPGSYRAFAVCPVCGNREEF